MEQLLAGKNLYHSLLKILLGYQRLYFCHGTKVLPCLGRFKKKTHTPGTADKTSNACIFSSPWVFKILKCVLKHTQSNLYLNIFGRDSKLESANEISLVLKMADPGRAAASAKKSAKTERDHAAPASARETFPEKRSLPPRRFIRSCGRPGLRFPRTQHPEKAPSDTPAILRAPPCSGRSQGPEGKAPQLCSE